MSLRKTPPAFFFRERCSPSFASPVRAVPPPPTTRSAPSLIGSAGEELPLLDHSTQHARCARISGNFFSGTTAHPTATTAASPTSRVPPGHELRIPPESRLAGKPPFHFSTSQRRAHGRTHHFFPTEYGFLIGLSFPSPVFFFFGATTSISSVTTFRHIFREGFHCITMHRHRRLLRSRCRYPAEAATRTGFLRVWVGWMGGIASFHTVDTGVQGRVEIGHGRMG